MYVNFSGMHILEKGRLYFAVFRTLPRIVYITNNDTTFDV